MNTAEFKHFKLYSDNILKKMNKDELIDYIHILHHNWGCTYESYFNVVNRAKDLQNKLDNIQQKVTDQTIIKNDEILKLRDEIVKLKGKKSKSAKEMFEDLGFKYKLYDGIICFEKELISTCSQTIEFELEGKLMFVYSSKLKYIGGADVGYIDIALHKAIHQQIKELEWL